MLNIERYRKELENYGASLDCDIHKIRENNEGIRNHLCISKTCPECRKENIEWLLAEYEGPILTEEEKEYLRAVIKPFRKFVRGIKKVEAAANGMEKISLYSQDFQSWGCTTILPPFKKSTGMFQNMELGREYNPEDLGL